MIFLKNRGQGRNFKNSDTVSCRYDMRRVCLFKESRAETAVKRATGAEKFFRAGCFAAVIDIVLFSAAFTGRAPAFPHTGGLYHTFCISPDCTVYPLVVYELPSRV